MNKFYPMLILVMLAFSINASALHTQGVVCDSCTQSQYEQSAAAIGRNFPVSGTVFVADFDNRLIKKYWTLREDDRHQTEKEVNETAIKANMTDAGENPNDYISATRHTIATVTVTVVEMTPTSEEQQHITDAIWLVVEMLRPAGGGRASLPGFPQLVDRRRTLMGDDRPVISSLDLYPGAPGSAFDVINNQSLGLEIGNNMTLRHETLTQIVRSARALSIVGLPFGGDFAIEFVFSDGSTGLWFVENRNQLFPDFSSFRDSEGNVIPAQQSDASNVSFTHRGGRDSSNFRNAVDRLVFLGFTMHDTGSACSATVTRCNNDGCTVTCLVH
ncbi:MAG: hypothetical protein Tsb002_26500 [Wenzhouxiangellaceae bacterium]